MINPYHVLLFVTFIGNNPGFAAALISVLVSSLAVLIGVYYRFIYMRLLALEKVDGDIQARVGSVEVRLERYEQHVGIGEQALRALTLRIERHMTEEEDQVWAGIRSLGEKLTELQIENTEAHAKIVTEHGERLAVIETQLTTKTPNGNIQEMMAMLRKLTGQKA